MTAIDLLADPEHLETAPEVVFDEDLARLGLRTASARYDR